MALTPTWLNTEMNLGSLLDCNLLRPGTVYYYLVWCQASCQQYIIIIQYLSYSDIHPKALYQGVMHCYCSDC